MWWILTVIVAVFIVAVFLVWSCASIRSNVWLRAYCRVDSKEKEVFLTFDDGPMPESTEAVLEILRRRNAKAAFFIIGAQLRGNEDIVRKIVSDGHLVGAHSFSHKNIFPLFSSGRMKRDVQDCIDGLESLAGHSVTLFRPPFGVVNPTLAKVVNSLSLKTVGWNIRSFDTVDYNKPNGVDAIVERIMRQLKPGSIILLHDRLPNAPQILTELLDGLDRSGYRYDRNLPL